jgi:hypothetical protein
MANVVINEFEIVPASEPLQDAAALTKADKPAAPAGPTEQDIERVLRRTYERSMRLRAH